MTTDTLAATARPGFVPTVLDALETKHRLARTDAARYLVVVRGVGALGADVASIDYGASKDFIVHQIAAKAGVLGLENLAAVDALPPTGATIIALPMKIEGGSGGPLRAVALVPRAR